MKIVFTAAVALVALTVLLLGGLAILYSALGIPFPLSVLLIAGVLGAVAAAMATVRSVRRLRRAARRRALQPLLQRGTAQRSPSSLAFINAAVLVID